jgi:type IV secretion system protein TrbI
MQRATYAHQGGLMQATHVRAIRVILLVVAIPVLLFAAGLTYLRWYGKSIAHTEAGISEWIPTQRVAYTPEAPPKPAPAPEVVDPMAERWALLQRQLAQMQNDIAALQNRKEPTPQVVTKPPAPAKKHAPMLFVGHEDKTRVPSPDTYTLAPGATKLACQVETVMNSDAGETFTAKVMTPVYDTATGKHLLIPQSSTILGTYEAEGLLFGNERLPTLGLSVTLPNGQVVDLGKAPVTNGPGAAGLVSRVDEHWGRLIGAVFIGGALRGGAMALQTSLVGAGALGQLGAGVTQSGEHVIQRQQGRAIDTRPTMHVDAGELCQVILTRPLQLAAVR